MPKISFSLDDLISGCAELKRRNKFTPGYDELTPYAAETYLHINGRMEKHADTLKSKR